MDPRGCASVCTGAHFHDDTGRTRWDRKNRWRYDGAAARSASPPTIVGFWCGTIHGFSFDRPSRKLVEEVALMRKVRRWINPSVSARDSVCQECSLSKGWWLHLRRCAECGHIGCCDSSPNQHALQHALSTGHMVVASFEPLQNWFFDYEKRRVFRSSRLSPPVSHPEEQAAPGPLDRLPVNWESLLHDV